MIMKYIDCRLIVMKETALYSYDDNNNKIIEIILVDTFESRVSRGQLGRQRARTGRQQTDSTTTGVDFTSCVTDQETGLCCVDKEETVTSLEKEPILECHYSYVTEFKPSQEEVCEENFDILCSTNFRQTAFNEAVEKCPILTRL